jgi:hypothetical protein
MQSSSQNPNQSEPQQPAAHVTLRSEFGVIVIGAIIFTASFLWKDFFTDIQNQFFPITNKHYLVERFVYVFISTIVLILVALYLQKTLFPPSTQQDNSLNNYPVT